MSRPWEKGRRKLECRARSLFDAFMGGLKTILVMLLVLPPSARAEVGSLVATFATCTGRFSAELEHAWLMQDARTDEIAHRRTQFIDLLDAAVPTEGRRHALHLRIDAKIAHAQLLTAAVFSRDPDRSEWAAQRARSEIDYCTGFLLEG